MKTSPALLRIFAVLATVLAVILSAYTPVTVLAFSARASWAGVWQGALNSLLLSLGCGLLSTALGVLVALILWEGMPRSMKKPMQYVIYATAGLPSAAIAMAAMLAIPGEATLARLVIALALSTAPCAARYMIRDLDELPPYAMDALHALGANGLRTIVDGILPHSGRYIASTALYACSRIMSEVAILSVILTPDWQFLSLRLANEPLSPATFPTALLLCAGAMLTFDRAQALRGRR